MERMFLSFNEEGVGVAEVRKTVGDGEGADRGGWVRGETREGEDKDRNWCHCLCVHMFEWLQIVYHAVVIMHAF